ncbi:FIST N-terminal domain-containing protein [Methanocaldococcus fervens]|uniref:Transcriptional regulator, TrmB n=1 Tax=Methanocaldococcus fervens (strain DSM 4213 / JCM 15782 / AG86) TaxID=573064 RepID=C7P5K8_METFA|nr:FIST N-terminal domain-containing protein [Methanocaldococcus fervens]ACV25386.1 transcriptional regulator, TrmB [Methanocaldococcus fervens AG86]
MGNPSLIIFITTVFDEDKLKKVFEGMQEHISLDGLVGCSAGGTFVGNKYIKKDGVLILAFDGTFKYATACKKIGDDPRKTGIEIANEIKNTLGEKYAYSLSIEDKFVGFVFFDWHMDHEQEILNALGGELGFSIVGGTAGDDSSFENFFQIYKGEVVRNSCVFGVVGGKLKFDVIYGHGYEPTNVYARVTKSEGRVVYELDNKPAYQRYLEMISEYTKLPINIVEKYLDIGRIHKLKFSIYFIHPLGFIDMFGNVITAFLEASDGDKLIFRREIPEGMFMVLMRTDLEKIVRAIYDRVLEIKKEYKNPLIFINQGYGIEILKNPLYRKFEKESLPYLSDFYNDTKKIEEYVLGDDCIGWVAYGETISKDIIRLHNNISFTGVVFELEEGYIDWREALKYFDFTDEEIEVIVNLINNKLDINELSKATNIPVDRLKDILKKLQDKEVVKYIDVTEKYYIDIDDLKDALKKIDEEMDKEYKVKKAGREMVLKRL